MKSHNLTNSQLMTTDFSEKERKASLRSISPHKPKIWDYRLFGISMSGIWMTDVSIMDRRSVKAQLAGHGDYRSLWWDINSTLHRLYRPHSTLEQRMYRFHFRHHALTLFYYRMRRDYCELFQTIKYRGLIAGIRYAAMQIAHADKEQP